MDSLVPGLFIASTNNTQNMWPDSGNALPGEEGVGVAKALEGYANWISTQILPGREFCQF